jgi:hypothetical protein
VQLSMSPILTASCIYIGPRDDLERTEHLEEQSPHHREHGSSLAAPLIQSRTFTQSLQPITGQFSSHKQRHPIRKFYKVHRPSFVLIPIRNSQSETSIQLIDRTNTCTLFKPPSPSNQKLSHSHCNQSQALFHATPFQQVPTNLWPAFMPKSASDNKKFHILILEISTLTFQSIVGMLLCHNQHHPIIFFHTFIKINPSPPSACPSFYNPAPNNWNHNFS